MPARADSFWWALWGMERKPPAREVVAHQVPEDAWICSHGKPRLVQQLRLESPPGRAYDNVLSPSRIHAASTQAKRKLDRDVGDSRALRGGADVCSPSRSAALALVYYFVGGGIWWLPLGLSRPSSPHSRRRSGNRWGFCQLRSLDWGVDHCIRLGSCWSRCDTSLNANPRRPWTPL